MTRPREVDPGTLSVVVPDRTRSGPVELRGVSVFARAGAIRIPAAANPTGATGRGFDDPLPGDAVFPIRGAREYGTSINRFRGGRAHQGQDVFADCGTTLVAALAGRVIKATYASRAGNYVVIQHPDGRSTAYLQMRRAALVGAGDQVLAGDVIGEVGNTGRASGCHLHFELWTAPGWYCGGRAMDPLRVLRAVEVKRAES